MIRFIAVRVGAALAPWAVSAVLFWVALMIGGAPQITDGAWIDVHDGPAREAGLQDGDRVTRVNGRRVESWEELRAAIRIESEGGQNLEMEIEREGRRQKLVVKPRDGKIGVAWHMEKLSAAAAASRAASMPWTIVRASAAQWWGFHADKKAELAGPVRIVEHTAEAGKAGVVPLLQMLSALVAYLWPFALVAVAAESFMTLRKKVGT